MTLAGMDLRRYGLVGPESWRNAPPALLYEHAVRFDSASVVAGGALAVRSGAKTGRSPRDKRIVERPSRKSDIWWGPVNIPLAPAAFRTLRRRAIDYLNVQPRLYVVDGLAGWEAATQVKVRVICARAYHALFMHNLLIRPTPDQLSVYGEPDHVMFNAGQFPADPETPGLSSPTTVSFDLEAGETVILGTEYAGEMKKGVFTLMNYLLPAAGVLPMHCSANEGASGDVTLFFGLSGTGKTTLSADPYRRLIGDDEHGWSDRGVFNIEGGCYAKCIGLSREREPEIFHAIDFGAVLENVVFDADTRIVDFADAALTENTRASYPIEAIANAKTPCVGGHPRNIIFLTCDAFGVLPPVSRLSPDQARRYFLAGYTAKVAGTEVGVTEPEATFSACFGAAFLVRHPAVYAEMLAARMRQHGAAAWLVNTGWTGGPYGVGRRMPLATTRAIIDAIHAGELASAPTVNDPIFGLATPTACRGCPSELLQPRGAWSDGAAYDRAARRLAEQFDEHAAQYATPPFPSSASSDASISLEAKL